MPDHRPVVRHRGAARRWLILMLIAVLAAGGWWFYDRKADQQPAQGARGGFAAGMRGGFGGPTPVRAAVAELRRMDHVLRAIGTVTPLNTVAVRSRVDGELQSLEFDDGAWIERGDVLAHIDPRTWQVQLDQALGQQAQTQAQLANARQDLKRYQQLFQQQSLARQQLDTQQALVNQLEATARANQAAVDQARLQLEFTEVRAPITGRLGLRQVDVGNLVGAADVLVTITQTRPIAVQFSLPQADLPVIAQAMQSGRKLDVRVYGSDDTTLLGQGVLAAIDNQIDAATGTVLLKASLPNNDNALFPNQFVNVALTVESGESLAVPVAAVQYGSVGAFVYVVDDQNKARIQTVVPGQTHEDYMAIHAGLTPGAAVVTDGIDRLREGSDVDVVADEPPPAGVQADDSTLEPLRD